MWHCLTEERELIGGGGDTLEAIKRAGVSEGEVSHVSTGSGASLRFLAGNQMPGIEDR
ncbi:MAG TPA: phosphoglycerate kinase [Candidatus Bathyarchaeia archaeon]|nr:phosphoglycerate kinase [Candidatus Bathyarchaeia archaeon]